MVSFEPRKFERYLVNINEPIDRLTTNRVFQRIYEDVEKITGSDDDENIVGSSKLSLRHCTDNIYGTARFSASSDYEFSSDNIDSSTSADYYDGILNIDILKDYSDSLSDRVSSSVYWAPSSDSHTTTETNNYWIKTDYCNVDFSYMPNGITMITSNMEIGFNNIQTMFGGGTEMLSGDIASPSTLSGYDTYINVTESDANSINEYTSYNDYADAKDVENLKKMNGMKVTIPFSENFDATLHHNICRWTTYSNYRQSYVELHYSSRIDVKKLYDEAYRNDKFDIYSRRNGITDSDDMVTDSFRHPKIVFEQKPMVMMQVGFYGGDEIEMTSVFGHDNRLSATESVPATSVFNTYDTITEQPITVNSENSELSPVNGHVEIKRIENIYDENGAVTNNVVYFDVVMKFMVGSAADPKMIYGLTTINSRAKVQFAMIGV